MNDIIIAPPPSCGNCLFHDKADCNNSNGRCKNANSPRFDVVTGKQGCCSGWTEAPPQTPPEEQPVAAEVLS
jgi:hypothetical protein